MFAGNDSGEVKWQPAGSGSAVWFASCECRATELRVANVICVGSPPLLFLEVAAAALCSIC
jgi:hypothetical protein